MAQNERTCLVTGKTYPVSELNRFTMLNGEVVFDGDTKNQGRGGYIHKNQDSEILNTKLRKKVQYFMRLK